MAPQGCVIVLIPLWSKRVFVTEWVPVDVDVWACACSSIITNKAPLVWTLPFIKHFTSIIPLSPHETLQFMQSENCHFHFSDEENKASGV